MTYLSFDGGFPPKDFFGKAWASEPLTNTLQETDIPFALPAPDEDISLIAKNEQDFVVGQCSANRVVKYWKHLDEIDATDKNLSTQIFVAIHKKAVEDEKKYLKQKDVSIDQSFHSAGIAVLPEYRRKHIGLAMRTKQIELCKQHKATTLFCETTNLNSVGTVETLGFTKISEYPYSQLAGELNHPDLGNLQDSFTVWCLNIKK